MLDLPPAPVKTGLSDQEIDALVRRVADGHIPEEPPRKALTGYWYLAAFLLGMTAMEGLRLVAVPQDAVRGAPSHRCQTVEVNPPVSDAVAQPAR